MNKHKAIKHEYRGMKFDSGRELKRWKELEILEASGSIKFLSRQTAYVLAKSVILNHRRKPALRYIADFVYYCNERGRYVVEDAKSPHLRTNQAYRIKKHLMMSVHGIEIEEV